LFLVPCSAALLAALALAAFFHPPLKPSRDVEEEAEGVPMVER
jgi:hypothetical protein